MHNPNTFLGNSMTAFVVALDRAVEIIPLETDLPEVNVGHFVFGSIEQNTMEPGRSLCKALSIEFVDGQIFSSRVEVRINLEGLFKRLVGLVTVSCAGQGNAEQVERFQVMG